MRRLGLGWYVVFALAAGAPGAPVAAAPSAQPATSGAIEGYVYFDTDADGVFGPSEPGLRIVPVRLDGPVNRTVLTWMNGAYRFGDLPPGTYDVAVEPGASWHVRSQGAYAGLVVDGDTLANVNFGVVAADGATDADGTGDAARAAGLGTRTDADGTGADATTAVSETLAAASQVLGAVSEDGEATLDPTLLVALREALDAAEPGSMAGSVVGGGEFGATGGAPAMADAYDVAGPRAAPATERPVLAPPGASAPDAGWTVAGEPGARAAGPALPRDPGVTLGPPAGEGSAAGPMPAFPHAGAGDFGGGTLALAVALALATLGAAGRCLERR